MNKSQTFRRKRDYQYYTMYWPAATKPLFAGAKGFVELYGAEIWCTLCDTQPVGEWMTFAEAEDAIRDHCDGLKNKAQHPGRYLRQVVYAVLEDVRERPQMYEEGAPVQVTRNRRELRL
jgi:hypothetical protein